eukprot:Nk52_evm18s208 gene=Nk52_evmTU18s208
MKSGMKILELVPNKDHYRNNHFEVPLGTVLRFSLGPELQSHQVRLYCNYPKDGAEFVRSQFTELKWSYCSKTSKFYNVGERYCDLVIGISGPFEFRFKYFSFEDNAKNGNSTDGEGISENSHNVVCGYFVVEPTLYLNKKVLPFDSLCIETYVTKCLGPVSGWKKKLQVSQESGYNMIHFTPCQELGFSKSAYSLKNQLKLNPNIFPGDPNGFVALEDTLHYTRTQMGMLCISDVVWNHTANNSPWIDKEPDCGFNLENSPHLKPAYVVDEFLQIFSMGLANGEFPSLPNYFKNEHDLDSVMKHLEDVEFPKMKLWEFYVVNAEHTMDDFKERLRSRGHPGSTRVDPAEREKPIVIVKDNSWDRNFVKIDMDRAVRVFNVDVVTANNETERIEECCRKFKEELDKVNIVLFTEYDEDVRKIVSNLRSRVHYERIAGHGPKFGPVTANQPLTYSYFVRLPSSNYQMASLNGNILGCVKGRYVVACNGWIWAADPLKNFAAPGSKVYLVRDLIVWGDCIKLNYGEGPKSSPFLWDFMKKYTVQTAKLFDGFRIDNCHSTPLHVAEYLLDEARKVNPNLYVLAELFSGSETVDNMFVNKLGLNSLVREAMQAGSTGDLGRTVHVYGGYPVGSFNLDIGPSYLTPSRPHAILMDCTHDNEVPLQKRTVYDTLPNAALTCMASCAVGSTRGYDELLEANVDVVHDARFYKDWCDIKEANSVGMNTGIIKAKKVLNKLHKVMGDERYSHMYLDHFESNIISVTRECRETHNSFIAFAHTAFNGHDIAHYRAGSIKDVTISGKITEIVLEARIDYNEENEKKIKEFTRDSQFVGGIPISCSVHDTTKEHSKMCSVRDVYDDRSGLSQVISFTDFPPGSVIIFKVCVSDMARKAFVHLHDRIAQYEEGRGPADEDLNKSIESMSFIDLNYALYLCHEEGMDINGIGGYDLPHFGQIGYCGLQGIASVFAGIRMKNDLAHPLCNNLRDGDWLIDFTSQRLEKFEGTAKFGKHLKDAFQYLKQIPRYLIPRLFDALIYFYHERLTLKCLAKMSPFIRNEGCRFEKKLALGSVQLYGGIPSAPYPTCKEFGTHKRGSLAAGLTHFATGYMRCWGRDTFISLRGMLLVTGRFQEARDAILGFAMTLRHGLIPNLLDGGKNSRFNCRDAAWWFLQSIKDYCSMSEEGVDFLKAKVPRLFPDDNMETYDPNAPLTKLSSIAEIIQEIMEKHAAGISFREWNAGERIDSQMVDEGFNVNVELEPNTWLPTGGNEHNCGTWMDKMGSSVSGGNKGVPATPRNGVDVEIAGLCKSTVSWLSEIYEKGIFAHEGVRMKNTLSITSYKEWNDHIENNFEKYFWIPEDPKDDCNYAVNSSLINKRGIYKDIYGCSKEYCDYQLRPNLCVAMTVAPEMFHPKHALKAIQVVEENIVGPLGMRTLDPSDWEYRPFYDNANDSGDFNTSGGLNYHQGPEWVWCIGYFLRAKLIFMSMSGCNVKLAVQEIHRHLIAHKKMISSCKWRGLPELTNKDGELCKDSCVNQAWSVSCVLDTMYDIAMLMQRK